MSKAIVRPEILRMQIIEVTGLRKFVPDSDGPSQARVIEDLLSKEVSSDKLKTHVEETGEAILGSAGLSEFSVGLHSKIYCNVWAVA